MFAQKGGNPLIYIGGGEKEGRHMGRECPLPLAGQVGARICLHFGVPSLPKGERRAPPPLGRMWPKLHSTSWPFKAN